MFRLLDPSVNASTPVVLCHIPNTCTISTPVDDPWTTGPPTVDDQWTSAPRTWTATARAWIQGPASVDTQNHHI